MSTWGDVAGYRNQQPIDQYRDDHQSIWDERNVDDYDDWQDERKGREQEAQDSWGNPDGQDDWGANEQPEEQPKRKGGPGSRGGTPAEFKHAQQRSSFLGHERGPKRRAKHPIKKKIKSKFGTQSHSFHNPNGQR